MSAEGFTRFVEDNAEELKDRFIEKYKKEWDNFTFSAYSDSHPLEYEEDR